MRTVDLIQRKRDGEELAPEEIEFLVEGYTRGDIPDYQMSSFLERDLATLINWHCLKLRDGGISASGGGRRS